MVMCALLGQVLHRISHFSFSSLCHGPQHQGCEEDIKIVLGLEAEPHQGTTHYWGLPYLLVTSGAHSNKQTNKQTNNLSFGQKFYLGDAGI